MTDSFVEGVEEMPLVRKVVEGADGLKDPLVAWL